MSDVRILQGDCRVVLRGLPENSVQCCVTSPPYWGLRRYPIPDVVWGGVSDCLHVWADVPVAKGPAQTQGATSQRIGRSNVEEQVQRGIPQGGFCLCGAWRGQLGNEPTPDLYVEHLVDVFREVRRVLRDDGTLWLNLGDSYAANRSYQVRDNKHVDVGNDLGMKVPPGLKPKDLVGIPWRTAFALQADGWWLRAPIIWEKPNTMPDSTDDRVTISHEYIFMLTKSARYFYDNEAIKEPLAETSVQRLTQATFHQQTGGPKDYENLRYRHDQARVTSQQSANRVWDDPDSLDRMLMGGRNKRSVWHIPTAPYRDAHFATFPPKLVEPCILAGTSARGACPACGAPWRRVLARVKHPDRDIEAERAVDAKATGRTDGKVNGPEGQIDDVETVGWEPTCSGKHANLGPSSAGAKIIGNVKAARDVLRRQRAEAGEPYTKEDHSNPMPQKETVGWEPRCGHGDAEPGDLAPVPCVVLDPFGGSGTTGTVAQQYGRDAIVVELAAEYISMIEQRTREQSFVFDDEL